MTGAEREGTPAPPRNTSLFRGECGGGQGARARSRAGDGDLSAAAEGELRCVGLLGVGARVQGFGGEGPPYSWYRLITFAEPARGE